MEKVRVFGDNSEGFLKETEMVNYINETQVFGALSDNMQNLFRFLYPGKNLAGAKISAEKCSGYSFNVKPDVVVCADGEKRFLSLKTGGGNSVHQEPVENFVDFLRHLGVSELAINCLLEFHYGDGSRDGNGAQRISATAFSKLYPEKIRKINEEVNNLDVLLKVFDRLLFVGNAEGAPIVDAIYHGTVKEGLWASREEIIEYFLKPRKPNSVVYFAGLSYQPWNRCLSYDAKKEYKRKAMQSKWSSLEKDLKNIRSKG